MKSQPQKDRPSRDRDAAACRRPERRAGKFTSPLDCELQGRTGGAWVTLDPQGGETGWIGAEERSYIVANPGEYADYRVLFNEDNDSRSAIVVIRINELRLAPPRGRGGGRLQGAAPSFEAAQGLDPSSRASVNCLPEKNPAGN